MYYVYEYAAVLISVAGCFAALHSDLSSGRISNRLTGSMLFASAALAVMRIAAGDAAFLWLSCRISFPAS